MITKVPTTDGTLKYTNASNHFLSPEFTYQPETCRIISETQEIPAFKVVYISSMPGFFEIKAKLCTDTSCSAYQNESELEMFRQEP